MKYKIYRIKIKIAVVNDKVIKKLKTDINYRTRSLIYNWVRKYQKNNNKLTTSYAFKTNNKIDKINIQNKIMELMT